MKRWDLINALIKKFDYKTYLEIGVNNGDCFKRIDIDYKIGVDPNPQSKATLIMTSDEFFQKPSMLFDIVFIDGLHESSQVNKDIEHALKILSYNGTIVVHDCNPQKEIHQRVPRESKHWNGDVWKAWVNYRINSQMNMFVVDCDEGCGVIRPKESRFKYSIEGDLAFENLDKNRYEWLNLVSTNVFETWLNTTE